MSDVKECDRCSRLIEDGEPEYKYKINKHSPKRQLLELDDEGDLCRECRKDFKRWMG